MIDYYKILKEGQALVELLTPIGVAKEMGLEPHFEVHYLAAGSRGNIEKILATNEPELVGKLRQLPTQYILVNFPGTVNEPQFERSGLEEKSFSELERVYTERL